MVSKYHSIIEKGIFLAGEELIKLKKIRKVLRGNEHPLSLTDSASKLVLNYKPDVYYVLRNNKKMIFEVLDSEEQDKIIADVTRSFLIENTDSVIFVYDGGEKHKRMILEALITIAKGLFSKGMPEEEIPFNKSGPFAISKDIASSPEKVKKIILDNFFQ